MLTVLTAEATLGQVLSGSVDPNIPPLYYLLIHFILPFGTNEALLRLPSAILGSLSIPLVYEVIRR